MTSGSILKIYVTEGHKKTIFSKKICKCLKAIIQGKMTAKLNLSYELFELPVCVLYSTSI